MRRDERVAGCSFSVVCPTLLVLISRVGGGGWWGDEREVAKFRLGRVPDFDRVCVVADEVLQVDCQSAAVTLEAGPRGVDALGDVEDDRGEAVLVDVDFLAVGNLADLARRGGISISAK